MDNVSKEGKYSVLFEDAYVKRWLGNLARGSLVTAEFAQRRLGRLCEILGLSPKELIAEAKRDLASFQDVLKDVCKV